MPYRDFTNNNTNTNYNNNNRSEANHKQQWNQDYNTSKDKAFDGFGDKNHDFAYSGRKRPFPFSDRSDHTDDGGLIKLFIGNVPSRAIEDDIRPLFEEHGNVVEIIFIRDKTSGQQQGYCFVKYSTLEDAERAIKALNSQYTFPGEFYPIRVRYADRKRLHSMQGTLKDNSFDGFQEKDHDASHSDRKHPFPFSDRPDNTDNGGVMKLYIANVPRTAIEDDIRPLFEEHGKVVEISFVMDKTSDQQRGCYIKYSTSEDTERAVKALDSKYTFPGEYYPIRVRYVDGKPFHRMQDERKLYVLGLHKQATENEIAEIFSTYGRVEDVCILRDGLNQSLGRGFVKFMQWDMSLAAINALNGTYIMTGCDRPLVVRFANPRKPQTGESRNYATFRGSAFGPRVITSTCIRPESNDSNPTCLAHTQSNGCKTTSPQSSGPSSQVHDFVSHSVAKKGAASVSMGTNSEYPVIEVSSGGQLLPLEKQLHPSLQLVPDLRLRTQGTPYTSQMKTPLPPVPQWDQLQIPTFVGPCSQALPPEHLNGVKGHSTQLQSQESTFATAAQHISFNVQTEDKPSTASQKQLCGPAIQRETQKPLEKSSNQLPEVPPQLSQTATQELRCDDTRQQSPFTGNMQQAATSPATIPTTLATSSTVSIPLHTLTARSTSEWSEHTCPDGFKYYYNCITKESRWEKPKELIFIKGQQLKLPALRAHIQSRVQDLLISTNSPCQMHLSATSSASRERYNDSGQSAKYSNRDRGFYQGGSPGSNRGSYRHKGCVRGDQRGDWNREKQNGDTQSYVWSDFEGDQVVGRVNQGSENNRTSNSGWNKGKPHGDDQCSGWSKGDTQSYGWGKGEGNQVRGWGDQGSGNNETSDIGWIKVKPHVYNLSGWSKDAYADVWDQVEGSGSQVSGNKDTCNRDWNGEKANADNKSVGWRTQISGATGTSNSEGWAGKQSERWNQSSAGWSKTISAKKETNKSCAQADDPWGKTKMNSWGEENLRLGGIAGW